MRRDTEWSRVPELKYEGVVVASSFLRCKMQLKLGLGDKSWQCRNPQSQFWGFGRLLCASIHHHHQLFASCAWPSSRQLKMPPKKKVERPATENISLGPQVREGAHVRKAVLSPTLLTRTLAGEMVFGVARIFASFNDTFVHITDLRFVS